MTEILQQALDDVEVLFVDLDGTLVATDVLWEALTQSVRRNPHTVLQWPVWLAGGWASFKRRLAERVSVAPEDLPYRKELLDLITEKRQRGCKVVLATASDACWAADIAQHLQVFDDVLASNGRVNLKGDRKLAAIQEYCRSHELQTFGYVGDAGVDMAIWRHAAQVYAVQPSTRLLREFRGMSRPPQIFGQRSNRGTAVLRAMRPHQWVKNLLLIVPLLLAHEWWNAEKLFKCLVAIVAFCACSSAVYVANDVFDVAADRKHPRKRRRPFACGALPMSWALPLVAGLLAVAFGLSLLTSDHFAALLVLYLAASSIYSLWLKSEVLADVLLLAGLYTLRLLAGGAASATPVSEWLLAFSLFLFTSLAFAKRYTELDRVARQGDEAAHGRGYLASDLSLIETFGPTSGYLSVLVLALYLNSEKVRAIYFHPAVLWLACPVLLYWISRVWMLAKRRQLNEDPVVFAITDRVSLLLGVFSGGLLAAASIAW